jgi:ribbon-helix-helix protein, copG family
MSLLYHAKHKKYIFILISLCNDDITVIVISPSRRNRMQIMTIRVPQELQKKLSEEAKKRGQTRNGLVLQILWRFVEKEELHEESED